MYFYYISSKAKQYLIVKKILFGHVQIQLYILQHIVVCLFFICIIYNLRKNVADADLAFYLFLLVV